MNIKFNDVSLIKNYHMINEENYLIKINMNFEKGKIYLVKGDDSKYYLAKLIMNFIEPTFGTIEVFDYELKRNRYIKNIKGLRQKIAYLPYDYDDKFNYHLVNNIFKEILYNYHYHTDKDDELVNDIIDKTGCYLASLLIINPEIIILEKVIDDEKIRGYLEYLAHEEKKTVIFIGNYKMKVDKTYLIENSLVSEVEE